MPAVFETLTDFNDNILLLMKMNCRRISRNDICHFVLNLLPQWLAKLECLLLIDTNHHIAERWSSSFQRMM